MANPQMILLTSNTVGSSGAATVTFNSIPQIYTDLLIKISTRLSTGNVSSRISFTSGTNSTKNLYANGATPASVTYATNIEIIGASDASTDTASTFSNAEFYIPNYTSGNQKSLSIDAVEESNATTAYMSINAGLSTQTAPIDTITFTPVGGGNFVQYSSFYLYGITRQ